MEIEIIVCIGAVFISSLFLSAWLNSRLLRSMTDLKFKLKSQSTKHGLLAEQFLPFSTNFPGDPKNFRFLGSPIDGVLFDDDKVLIVEFKSGRSRLSDRQKHIKELIEHGRVYFKEIRVGG